MVRQLRLGQALYHLVHRPRAFAHEVAASGGIGEYLRTVQGHAEMKKAARRLPPPPVNAHEPPLTLHLLTGKKYWDQTAFCLWTFARHTGRPLRPWLYDDGTLAPEHLEPLIRLFPETRLVTREETVARLNTWLPQKRFPFLRERWSSYPNIRKLINPHLGERGWKLVLDSDLLFFRRPDRLIHWLDAPTRPLHAVDCETCYGYSRALMNSLADTPPADLVNVGLTGLDSGQIDWERLEHWCAVLIGREGTHYFLEQALVAMLIAGQSCEVMPVSEYVTGPVEPEASACAAVMHHYVANSKSWYFQKNWRRAVPAGQTRPGPAELS